MEKKTQQDGPKTRFGKYMVNKFIPQYANNVQGLVYLGAAVLVIIVGLRGLGTVAGHIAIVPKFLLEYDPELQGSAVSPTWVMFALFLEFFLLLLMATTLMFTPEEEHGAGGHPVPQPQAQIPQLKPISPEEMNAIAQQVRLKIHEVAKEELAALDQYLAKLKQMRQS